MGQSSLLLDIPVPFLKRGGILYVEAQAANGLKLWASHFDRVAVCAPCMPENLVNAGMRWVAADSIVSSGKIEYYPLPWAFQPLAFLRLLPMASRLFRKLIGESDYLCFSNLGGTGAWGNIGVRVARKMGRQYAVWFDSVLHEISIAQDGRVLRKYKDLFDRRVSRHVSIEAVKGASVGLFHGRTVYDFYANLCTNPQVVHDVHYSQSDAISEVQLEEKLQELASKPDLTIGYLGRIHPLKAPLQWVDVASQVLSKFPKTKFVWWGEGPLRDQAIDKIRTSGLESSVQLPGFLSDRQEVLRALRTIDIFLFCHISPESPRVLVETLISGCPMVGYESSYARDLIGQRGGGEFVAIGDTPALASLVMDLLADRDRLITLTREAADSRYVYSAEKVFAHRAELIKTFVAKRTLN
jgi:colanic acid/amylovoran biosynthesis glycosyltransferase